jgi:hypothetical protein
MSYIEYNCEACGAHVLDENYVVGYYLDPKRKLSLVIESVCHACYGPPLDTEWAKAARASSATESM